MSTPLIESYRGIKVGLPPPRSKDVALLQTLKAQWLPHISQLKDSELQILQGILETFSAPITEFGTTVHGETHGDLGDLLRYLDNAIDSLKYLFETHCRPEGQPERVAIAHVIYETTAFFESYFADLINGADPSNSRLSPAKMLVSHYSVLNMSSCSLGAMATLDDLKKLRQPPVAAKKAASKVNTDEVKAELTKEQLQHFLEGPESFLREMFTAYARVPHRMQTLIQSFVDYLQTQFVNEPRYKKVIFYEALFQIISNSQFSEDFDSIELAFTLTRIFREDEDASLLFGYVKRKMDKLSGEITDSFEMHLPNGKKKR